jgi:outer membrane protein OmpA-like peptidoglycan-associated protein
MYDGRTRMFGKHCCSVTFALLVLWTGIASAQVSMSPDPINAGNVLVGASGSSSGTLSSVANGVSVDVVLTSTCNTGPGMTGNGLFELTSSTGSLTGISLNGDKTITVTYTPMTRGLRECTVDVNDTGTSTVLATFKVRGTGLGPAISTTPTTTYTFPTPLRANDAVTPHTATLNVVVSNSGDAGTDLVVSNASIVGGSSIDYAVTPTSATIPFGSTATFVVTFDPVNPTPTINGSTTTLQIASNDPVAATKNISLFGTGTTGVISVTDIAFGTVAVTQPSTQNIIVSNVGAAQRGTLSVSQAQFMNNTAGWFRFNTTGCAGTTIPCPLSMSITNGTATLPIMCDPPAGATGTQMASVLFTSDTDSSSDSIAMLMCTAGHADMTVDQTPLAFGDQLINATSTGKSVSISNTTGNIALTYSLSLQGIDTTQFIVTGSAGCITNCTLAAGASTTVSVAFRPTTIGAKSAALRVTSTNDVDTPFLDVPLGGNGVAPISTPSPLSLAFGDVNVGDTGTGQTLMVTNNGTYALTINAAYLFAGSADYVVSGATTGTAISISVQPMQSVSWSIACKPSVMNARPGTFRISSNSNGAPTNQDIGLTCNGLFGQLAFIAPPTNPYDFGGVREGDTRSQLLTLRNTGNTPVTNITAAFTGTGTGFSFAPTAIASIAGGAQVTVTATFAPATGNDGGTYTATYSGTWGTTKTTMASQTLIGDGLTTGYDTLPSSTPLDFGNVRFDQTKTMNVSVINTAGTTLQIRGFTITPGTAQSGEFYVSRCLKNAVQIICPTLTSPYTSSGINDTIVLQVTFDPNNRIAMMDATLTVTSDLAMNPNRNVMLKGASISAGVALNPTTMVLDFGPTDLDAVPVSVTRTVTLTNTGAAPLDVASVTKQNTPLTNPRFTFSTGASSFQLQPNASYDIQVTYTPIIEKPSNTPDVGSIIFGGVTGVFGGASSITVQLKGYGVDRHISVAPAPTFPDTYTSPDVPPTLPVTITNNGDATLNVTGVMLTNDPIWTLVNPDPVSVPGRGSYNFNVAFSPLMAGKAPTGRLTIMNNDNGMALVAVDLNGNGLDRQIRVGPPVIDLGYVGIGMTVRASVVAPSQMLTVESIDPQPWTITEIKVEGGDGAFVPLLLDGTPVPMQTDISLRTNETQKFDVEFTPTVAGNVEATAIVYLGKAPQMPVVLRGRGLYVDTGGGGGCSTGRGHGGGLALVLLALVLGRRRRGVFAAVALIGTSAAHAETTENRNVSLSMFDPTPAADVGATFQLQSADVADKGSFGVMTLVSYVNKPLLLRTDQNDDAAVENRTTLELGGVYSFGAFEVGARMPLFLQNGAALPLDNERMEMFGISPGRAARGDLTLHGKLQIGARGSVSYGFGAALTAPTASKDAFAGNELPTGRALFLLSVAPGPITITLNAGAVVRGEATLGSATQGSGAAFGGGLAWRAADKLWLAGEIFGELIPGGQTGEPEEGQAIGPSELGKPIEGLFGLRYQMARTTSLGLALGRGLTDDMGSPALRGVFALSFTPSAEALKPLHPPRPREPDKDADGDALKDELDACPNEPEDKDLFDDADGCPDLDNDGDGLADGADKCPLDAEDKDRFKDDDGCPDKDNDGDGVPDDKDRCPLASEDRDGVNDTDGCPDPDDDGDGLLDTVDKCPKEAEVINGNNDDDGCPDKGNSLVVLSPDRIETLEAIQFSGTKVARASNNVLGQIGATLRAHPEILRVRLTAHVQPTSNTNSDQKLSEQRAKAVRDWLVDWGIEPLRLQATGFGGSKPLVDPSTRGASQINDRLDLIILERK